MQTFRALACSLIILPSLNCEPGVQDLASGEMHVNMTDYPEDGKYAISITLGRENEACFKIRDSVKVYVGTKEVECLDRGYSLPVIYTMWTCRAPSFYGEFSYEELENLEPAVSMSDETGKLTVEMPDDAFSLRHLGIVGDDVVSHGDTIVLQNNPVSDHPYFPFNQRAGEALARVQTNFSDGTVEYWPASIEEDQIATTTSSTAVQGTAHLIAVISARVEVSSCDLSKCEVNRSGDPLIVQITIE